MPSREGEIDALPRAPTALLLVLVLTRVCSFATMALCVRPLCAALAQLGAALRSPGECSPGVRRVLCWAEEWVVGGGGAVALRSAEERVVLVEVLHLVGAQAKEARRRGGADLDTRAEALEAHRVALSQGGRAVST